MTAIPFDSSYSFRRWIGGPCDGSSNNVCIFELDQNQDIIAYFDIIPFTLTLINSGFGVGRTFTLSPTGFEALSFTSSPTAREYLSGQEITVFAEALGESTYVGMFSEDISPTLLNTTTFILTSNVTLTAVYLPFKFYNFELYKYGENRVIFTTTPSSNIDCNFTCQSASDTFTSNTNVVLNPEFAANAKISYYKTSVPIINRYIIGDGILSNETSVDILTDNQGFILANNSLTVNDGNLGAPYVDSFGIDISYFELSHLMTSDISVSAFLDVEQQAP